MMGKQTILRWLLIWTLLLCLRAHGAANGSLPSLTWDPNTLTLIVPGGGYARMIRLASGHLYCCYQRAGAIWVMRSRDEGFDWLAPAKVAEYAYGHPANPELLQLTDGTLLCFYNERPKDGEHPFTIMMVRSDKRILSWSHPQRLYTADVNWDNGCWEPAAIQLPSGEIQVFFANENPYRQSNEQEISLLRSFDEGRTWTEAETASMRAGSRDGMPVPLNLQGGRGLVVAIEDNGLSGRFKPTILYSTLFDSWHRAPVGSGSVQRWGAMRETLPAAVYAGAPYLRQMPSGHTILSFQTDAGGRQAYQMAVCIGDAWARDFGSPSYPFDLPGDVSGLWNSLCVKDANTVTALSGTTINGIRGIWAIDGHFETGAPSSLGEHPILSIWSHQVAGEDDVWLRFRADGTVDGPSGPMTWNQDGDRLVLRWPIPHSRDRFEILELLLSADRRFYLGDTRNGISVTGHLSQALGKDPFRYESTWD